jgi:hypothetical protein
MARVPWGVKGPVGPLPVETPILEESDHVQHPGALPGHVPCGGLFVERIELEQVLVGGAPGELLDPFLGCGEVLFQRHERFLRGGRRPGRPP